MNGIYQQTKIFLRDADDEELDYFQSGEKMGDIQNVEYIAYIDVTDVYGRTRVFWAAESVVHPEDMGKVTNVDEDDDPQWSAGKVKIKLKPLSNNRMWKGRKFKTDDYQDFERVLLIVLRKVKPYIPEGPVAFDLRIGVSERFDGDNAIKPILDICQKYCNHFDDVNVYDYHVQKRLVDVGNEYIQFLFSEFEGDIYDH